MWADSKTVQFLKFGSKVIECYHSPSEPFFLT